MHFSDPIIEHAFARCPVPSETDNGTFEDYLSVMEILGKDFYKLFSTLSTEHFELVANCFETLQMHSNIISHYYFERGWKAAKEDTALDNF